jgi:hypothetical protein
MRGGMVTLRCECRRGAEGHSNNRVSVGTVVLTVVTVVTDSNNNNNNNNNNKRGKLTHKI